LLAVFNPSGFYYQPRYRNQQNDDADKLCLMQAEEEGRAGAQEINPQPPGGVECQIA